MIIGTGARICLASTVCLVFAVLGLLFAQPVKAGDKDSRADTRLRQKEDELLVKRKELVREVLRLEPDMAKRFWPLYDGFQLELSELRAKRREVLTDLSHGVDGMSEAEAKEYVLDKLEYEERRNRLTREYIGKLAKFLSYKTLAVYIQVENKIRVYLEAGIEESIPLIR